MNLGGKGDIAMSKGEKIKEETRTFTSEERPEHMFFDLCETSI